MDSKDDDYSRREEDRPPEESSSWLSPSSRDKKSTEYTWEPGKYDRPFFNKFDPKKVFDKTTKESKELRKKIVIDIMSSVYKVDERAPYFKDTKLVKSERDDINLHYKDRLIAIYDTKRDYHPC